VDKYGDIYVADWGNNRVQALTAEGQHITTFTGQAGFSKWAAEKMNSNPDMLRQHNLVRDLEPSGRFWRPKAIEIDEQGRTWSHREDSGDPRPSRSTNRAGSGCWTAIEAASRCTRERTIS
jgi:hypothetical protein